MQIYQFLEIYIHISDENSLVHFCSMDVEETQTDGVIYPDCGVFECLIF